MSRAVRIARTVAAVAAVLVRVDYPADPLCPDRVRVRLFGFVPVWDSRWRHRRRRPGGRDGKD